MLHYYRPVISTFLVLVIFCNNAHQQNFIPPIACPDYFQYSYDGYQYIGKIALPIEQNNVHLVTHFSQHEPLQGNYYGRIILESRKPLLYRVEFPTHNELPKLTKITVNGQDICLASAYPPPSTRIFLDHTLSTQPLSIDQPQQNSLQQFFQPPQNSNNFITYKKDSPNIFTNTIQPQFTQTQQVPPVRQVPQAVQPSRQVPQFTQFQPTTRRTSAAGSFNQPASSFNPPASSFNQPAGSFNQPANSFNQPASSFNQQDGQCGEENYISALVLGGEVVMPGQFPWLTAIYHKEVGLRFICGGSLVSARTVVTAAHCFKKAGEITANRVVVNLGRHNLENYSDDFVTREIDNLIIHPEYDSELFPDADLALLQLNRAVQFTQTIRPICLWGEPVDFNIIVGSTGVIAGWGVDGSGRENTPVPKKVNTNIVSDSECLRSSSAFSSITSPRTFCAGNRDGSGPCKGDSGSGLMIKRNGRWYLRGIVSAGQTTQGTCDLREFVVYCDVAKHLQWVYSYMR